MCRSAEVEGVEGVLGDKEIVLCTEPGLTRCSSNLIKLILDRSRDRKSVV